MGNRHIVTHPHVSLHLSMQRFSLHEKMVEKEMRGKDTEKNIEEVVRVSHTEQLSKYQGKHREPGQGNSYMIIL